MRRIGAKMPCLNFPSFSRLKFRFFSRVFLMISKIPEMDDEMDDFNDFFDKDPFDEEPTPEEEAEQDG